MISAQDFNDKRSKLSEEVYLEQREKCERLLKTWIEDDFTSNYTFVCLHERPHPKLIGELEELGYVTKVDKKSSMSFYQLYIYLPQDVENTSLQDESGNARESAQEVGFFSKLKSFIKRILNLQ